MRSAQRRPGSGHGHRVRARGGGRWSRARRGVGERTTRRGRVRPSLHALEERAHRQLAHLQPRLMDGGERDVAQRGQRRVVVADQRDVVRHPAGRSPRSRSGRRWRPGRWRRRSPSAAGAAPRRRQRAAVAALLRVGARPPRDVLAEAEAPHGRPRSRCRRVRGARALAAVDVGDAAMCRATRSARPRSPRPRGRRWSRCPRRGARRRGPTRTIGTSRLASHDQSALEHGAGQDEPVGAQLQQRLDGVVLAARPRGCRC